MQSGTYIPKIKVLDDDPDVIEDFKIGLKVNGFTDNQFYTESKKFIAEMDDTTDVIILDYYLPPTNGMEVLEQIKKLNARARIIFISGRWDENIYLQLWNTGYGATSKLVKKMPGIEYLNKVYYYLKEHVENFLSFQEDLANLKTDKILPSEQSLEPGLFASNAATS